MHIGRVVELCKKLDGCDIGALCNVPAPRRVVGSAPQDIGQDGDDLGAWAESTEEAPEERGGLADATRGPTCVWWGEMWPEGGIEDNVSGFAEGERGGKAAAGPYARKHRWCIEGLVKKGLKR